MNTHLTMADVLKTAVPPYPHPGQREPSFLFCSNFLLHKESADNTVYHEIIGLSPLEQLIETMSILKMKRRNPGDDILPGDLIVIFHGDLTAENIVHTVISLGEDYWLGSDNYAFLSHVVPELPHHLLHERDSICTLLLHIDKQSYTFGQYAFDVWTR